MDKYLSITDFLRILKGIFSKVMKIARWIIIFWVLLPLCGPLSGQEARDSETTTQLFRDTVPLLVRLEYSNRDLLRETNDSTYMETVLHYKDGQAPWDSIPVRIRARGNYRKENCFLAPIKIKIKKKKAKGTLFEGNKELKLVYPCYDSNAARDYVLKEYLAYRFYAQMTPFHFKTRRWEVAYTDQRKRNDKTYQLEAFVIEDIDRVAERNRGNKLKRTVHPLQQDDSTSVQNDFFQFLIGNTDFSTAYQHNEKLVFVNGRHAIPVPYDFDMSGWVNTHYAVVSEIQDEKLGIDKVTERLFRGFKRSPEVFQAIRQEYLNRQAQLFGCLKAHETEFLNPDSYQECRQFLAEFYAVLRDDTAFREQILDRARTQ